MENRRQIDAQTVRLRKSVRRRTGGNEGGHEEGASLNCFQYTSRVGRVPWMCTSLNWKTGSFLLSLRVIMVVLIVGTFFPETL